MKRIVFISDFFVDQVLGGGEINDDECIKELISNGYDLLKIQSHLVTPKIIQDNKEHFFIISNFMNLEFECRVLLYDLNYLIYEHDHKYLKTRNPAIFKDFKSPSHIIVNYSFYKNATAVLCQSALHKKIVEENLNLDNIVSLGGNMWSLESLEHMREVGKKDKTNKTSVLNSAIEHKNTKDAIRFCQSKEYEYDLVSNPDYHAFLEQLGSNKRFVFFPKTPETLSRVAVEARMMGCSVVTSPIVGATSEPWFKLKGEELINFMEQKRKDIVTIILELVNKRKTPKQRPSISILTTFHDASKYMDNYMKNITNQTIFSDCELIMVDAGSVSNESQIIGQYAKKYSNIKHIRFEEKKPITECLNIAIQNSESDYLTFAFMDDIKREDCLEILYDEILSSDGIDLVYGDVICTNKTNDSFEDNLTNNTLFEHSRYEFSRENMVKCLPGPMPLWKKIIHEKNGFFNDVDCNYADDWEMWLRSVSTGSKFKKVNEKVGLYYSGGRSNQSDNLEQKIEEAKIFFTYRNIFGTNFQRYAPYFKQFIGR